MERITINHEVAQVSLEGARPLQPVDWMSERQVSYYIGDETSNIRVNDFRPGPNLQAIQAFVDKDRKSFAKSFSQPASVTIKEQDDGILIELTEPGSRPVSAKPPSEYPTLWLGVFKGQELTGKPVGWYALRDTGDRRMAFVAMVRPERPVD